MLLGVKVQGWSDMACPTKTAWELHKAWPQAKFHLVNEAGHAFKEHSILDKLIRATDELSTSFPASSIGNVAERACITTTRQFISSISASSVLNLQSQEKVL